MAESRPNPDPSSVEEFVKENQSDIRSITVNTGETTRNVNGQILYYNTFRRWGITDGHISNYVDVKERKR